MMKKLLFVALVLLLMQGCRCSREKNTAIPSAKNAVTEPAAKPADTHNSQNALDYEGIYEGTIPCADCPGIKAVVTLDREGNYTMTYDYMDGRIQGKWTGEYAWSADGRVITLKEAGGYQQLFQVGENVLFMLDSGGNRITGQHADMYVLRKKTDQPGS